jgi:anaerobic selenocysteine-containing dehydrogenase
MDEYQTPSGKLEFTATSIPDGVSPLPLQLEINPGEDELIMLNSSLPQYTHTQFRDVYNDIPCTAWVNPLDAEKYNLKDRGTHIIFNENGELHVTVKVTDRVTPGVIWTPRELIDPEGNIQNSLAPGTPQRIGGGPLFNTIKVRFKEQIR